MTSVNGLSGAGGTFAPPPKQELTGEQKSQISSILSNYDPENLSEDDAEAIVSALKDAGIRPGKGFDEAFEAAGFDAKEVGKLAGLEPPKDGPPPGPPPGEGGEGAGAEGVNAEGLQALKDLLADYDLTDLSDEEEESLLTALKDAGLVGDSGDLVSLKA
ncbi:MAG: hypothetical protein EP335_10125 [Alphaproteobacteria bacterium]|nr:MAG: hypothetical protein EP335_10125 [Alphaproteobacteria bacterium]